MRLDRSLPGIAKLKSERVRRAARLLAREVGDVHIVSQDEISAISPARTEREMDGRVTFGPLKFDALYVAAIEPDEGPTTAERLAARCAYGPRGEDKDDV